MLILNNNIGGYSGVITLGLQLAETAMAEGGWKEYFCESDQGDLRIENPITRAHTAILLENCKRWMAKNCRAKANANGFSTLDEATVSSLVGGFSDYLFPVIRASFPNNILQELVSTQPTNRKTATVVYWNWIVGKGKGSYTAGQRLFDANRGKQDIGFNFSNEVIDAEIMAALGGANATYTGILAFNDGGGIRPGAVKVTAVLTTAGAKEFFDNGQGGFIAPAGVTIASSSINYRTGAISITLTGDTFTTTAPVATYRWDSEGSSMVPQVDVQVVTSTAETERRALILNYSLEAAHDVSQEFGMALEPALLQGASEQLNYEISRQVIHELFVAAPVVDSFTLAPPSTEYNQQDHFRDLIFTLNKASNVIQSKTQKGYGNWLVVDEGGSNIIESLPAGMFVAAPRPSSINGPHFIGTLMNKWKVYKDMFLSKEPGASVTGNILMGFKGGQFFEAGYVWSPYHLMYTTDSITLANMVTQKGMASRYAGKMVNALMYVRINIVP
jgi:hypothetical protein